MEGEAAALEAAQEAEAGLQPRQRRRNEVSQINTSSSSFSSSSEEDDVREEGGEKSVYFDQEEGIKSPDDLSFTKLNKMDQFIGEICLSHGKTEEIIEDCNGHKVLPAEVKGHDSNNIRVELVSEPRLSSEENVEKGSKSGKMDNGSNSFLPSEECGVIEITRNRHENEVHEQVILVNKDKLEVAEFDVERVLEEQNTHDLYCPNCSSCITRRVILRKRKRIFQDFQYDIKRGRLREIHHNLDSSSGLTETIDQDQEREPDVFRCFSCLSFFIPTDSGFNLFHIFRKREENLDQHSPAQITDRHTGWYSSIFRSVNNEKKGSETDIPVSRGSDFRENKELANKKKKSIQNTSIPESGDIIMRGGQADTIEKLDGVEKSDDLGVPVPGETYFSLGEKMENVVQKEKQSVQTTYVVSEVVIHGKPQTYTEDKLNDAIESNGDFGGSDFRENEELTNKEKKKSIQNTSIPESGDIIMRGGQADTIEKHDGIEKSDDSGVPVPGETYFSLGEKMEDVVQKEKQSVQTTHVVSEVVIHGKPQTYTEDKLNDAIESNEGVLVAGESYFSLGEKMESVVQKEKQSVQTTYVVSEVVIHGKPQTYIEDKLNDAIENNGGILAPGDSYFSFGENVEKVVHKESQTVQTSYVSGAVIDEECRTYAKGKLNDAVEKTDGANDIIKSVGEGRIGSIRQVTYQNVVSESVHDIPVSIAPTAAVSPVTETRIPVGDPFAREERPHEWDVLKSIVFGGLVESITSLGVISSAAGADATTLHIIALGLANLISGLFIIAHDLSGLRNAQREPTDQEVEPAGRYWELLGRRENFRRHAIVAVLSYIIFGLLPPIIYGFSFRKSDDREYKLIAVAVASLLCVSLLAIGKAHVQPQKAYIKTLSYYIVLGVSASGISYVAGMMINRLLEKLGLFDETAAVVPSPPAINLLGMSSTVPTWASY